MKVYCKHCKWRIWGLTNLCRPKPFPNLRSAWISDDDTYYSKIDYRKIRAYKMNENNNCTYYKRKWWKFWVPNK